MLGGYTNKGSSRAYIYEKNKYERKLKNKTVKMYDIRSDDWK